VCEFFFFLHRPPRPPFSGPPLEANYIRPPPIRQPYICRPCVFCKTPKGNSRPIEHRPLLHGPRPAPPAPPRLQTPTLPLPGKGPEVVTIYWYAVRSRVRNFRFFFWRRPVPRAWVRGRPRAGPNAKCLCPTIARIPGRANRVPSVVGNHPLFRSHGLETSRTPGENFLPPTNNIPLFPWGIPAPPPHPKGAPLV